jgi:hypothetical protein
MDVYLPVPRAPGRPVAAVLLVHGEADPALLRGVHGWASSHLGTWRLRRLPLHAQEISLGSPAA